jgi:hypothetical protein
MPVRQVLRVGRMEVPMALHSKCLPLLYESAVWCERECMRLLALGVIAGVWLCGKSIAVYKQASARGPMFRRDAGLMLHGACLRTIAIVADVQVRLANYAGGFDLAWIRRRASVVDRARRCRLCGRKFLIGPDGMEYIRREGRVSGGASGESEWVSFGGNQHRACCRECLPVLRAALSGDER